MNKPVILAAGTPQVLLPFENASRFAQALPGHQGSMASWTAWQAPRTLKPAEAARLVAMDEAQLREVNDIPKGMLVKAGSTLLVPRSAQRADDVAVHLAEHAVLALAPELPPIKRVSFRAGRQGESVAAVAKRYRVAPALVAQWNGTTPAAHFKPGQRVLLMLPAGAGAARAATRVASRDTPKGGASKRVTRPAATARQRVAQN
jgi:membrane-bound lytic murein transglycosylase D